MRAYTDEDLRKYHKEPQRLDALFDEVERATTARPGFLFLGGEQSYTNAWYRYAKPKREILELAAPSCSDGTVTSFRIIQWERGPLVLFARGEFGQVLVCELRPGSEREYFGLLTTAASCEAAGRAGLIKKPITYRATFTGRKVGAIGVSGSITTKVRGETREQARLNLYERFDHIHGLKLTPVDA